MRLTAIAFGVALLASPLSAKSFQEMFPDIHAELPADLIAEIDALDLREGLVTIEGGIATLTLPEGYYFLGSKDANYILTTLWQNPPGTMTLGLVFPAGVSPFDPGSWALEVTFEEIGYVSDDDAGNYNYDELLAEMQADTRADSAQRVAEGYPEIELVGWAATPRYDKEARKLYWAKQLRFSDSETDTLNYSIRALGRRGVLVLNFIAEMRVLPQVEAAVPDVLAMVEFNDGHRYADFNPSLDQVAAVGIGGLIAGKVVAKTGLLVVGLAFLKKFGVLLLLPLLALGGRLFKKRDDT